MSGLFGGGDSAPMGPSPEEMMARRLEDSREQWTSYQEQRGALQEERTAGLQEIDYLSRIGQLSERAQLSRTTAVNRAYTQGMQRLESGSTYGLLRDVFQEQGGRGTLESFFTDRFGALEMTGPESEATSMSGDRRQQRAGAAAMREEDDEAAVTPTAFSFV